MGGTAEVTYALVEDAAPEGAAALQAQLESLPGVETVEMSSDAVRVRFDSDVVADEELLAVVRRAGYRAPGLGDS
jgi:copper chaperone CopZ